MVPDVNPRQAHAVPLPIFAGEMEWSRDSDGKEHFCFFVLRCAVGLRATGFGFASPLRFRR